ncbi:DUF4064 domain-containing protein [Sediminibacillus massiliensis]|uniref:DUF4064 domain-containing protein n=1 Tax=Sediminibacillus massiliensis TaxID=1926277 RepID=UPI00098831C9|nr:DUF4064 domain-containing protein [Sediminibacillus massiliensis]
MKRTVEIVLTVIGSLMFLLFTAMGAVLIGLKDNAELKQLMEDAAAQEPELSVGDLDTMIEMMTSGGWFLVISSIIAIIIGIICAFLMKGNKKPKLAGIILIVVGIAMGIIILLIGFIGGIFYLIAGIMCLVRKPKPETV